jgi:hypothetical protein
VHIRRRGRDGQALDEVVGAYPAGAGVPYVRYGAAFRRSPATLSVRCGVPGRQVALPRCYQYEKLAELCLGLSAERVTIYGVDVSAADIARIPAGNVRLLRAEFVARWQTARRFHEEQARRVCRTGIAPVWWIPDRGGMSGHGAAGYAPPVPARREPRPG